MRALKQLDAPDELCDWLAELDGDYDHAWDDCSRGEWLLWLAAAEQLPLSALLAATVDCVERAIAATPGPMAALREALACCTEQAPADRCLEAAAACEAVGQDAPASYREGPGKGYLDAAQAAAWVARAAEALAVIEARVEARQSQEALFRATSVGVPPAIMTPLSTQAITVQTHWPDQDPCWQDCAYFVATAAQAITHAARALTPESDRASRERLEAELSDLAHDRLAAVRARVRLNR